MWHLSSQNKIFFLIFDEHLHFKWQNSFIKHVIAFTSIACEPDCSLGPAVGDTQSTEQNRILPAYHGADVLMGKRRTINKQAKYIVFQILMSKDKAQRRQEDDWGCDFK